MIELVDKIISKFIELTKQKKETQRVLYSTVNEVNKVLKKKKIKKKEKKKKKAEDTVEISIDNLKLNIPRVEIDTFLKVSINIERGKKLKLMQKETSFH